MQFEFYYELAPEQQDEIGKIPHVSLEDFNFIVITYEIEQFKILSSGMAIPKNKKVSRLINTLYSTGVFRSIKWNGKDAIIGFSYH